MSCMHLLNLCLEHPIHSTTPPPGARCGVDGLSKARAEQMGTLKSTMACHSSIFHAFSRLLVVMCFPSAKKSSKQFWIMPIPKLAVFSRNLSDIGTSLVIITRFKYRNPRSNLCDYARYRFQNGHKALKSGNCESQSLRIDDSTFPRRPQHIDTFLNVSQDRVFFLSQNQW